MKDRRFRLVTLLVIVSALTLVSCGTKKKVAPPVAQKETPRETVAPVPEEKPVQPAPKEYEFVDVNFEYDKYRLTPTAERILAQHAKTLVENPTWTVRVEGHCDERGTVEYNLALGDKRASSVKSYLVQYGVRADNITTISYGKERPKDPRHNEDGWEVNRRAEFHVKR